MAIQLLRQAAADAEQAGSAKLALKFIDNNLRQWQVIRSEAQLAPLSEHEKIILELVKHHTPIGSTELAGLYVAYCRDKNLQPMARRTFTKYLSRLIAGGMVNAVSGPASQGGRQLRATPI